MLYNFLWKVHKLYLTCLISILIIVHFKIFSYFPCDFLFEPRVLINCQIFVIFQISFRYWFLIYSGSQEIHNVISICLTLLKLGPKHDLFWECPCIPEKKVYSAYLDREFHKCQLGQVFYSVFCVPIFLLITVYSIT